MISGKLSVSFLPLAHSDGKKAVDYPSDGGGEQINQQEDEENCGIIGWACKGQKAADDGRKHEGHTTAEEVVDQRMGSRPSYRTARRKLLEQTGDEEEGEQNVDEKHGIVADVQRPEHEADAHVGFIYLYK